MPGPTPKDASVRARRNRPSTAATLRSDITIVAPELPKIRQKWHPFVLAWWDALWASPMAPEFTEADHHGLFKLAMLHQDFWRATSPSARKEAATEIRLQEQRFGLSPIDRRRLQWEIERVDEAKDRGRARRERRTAEQRAAGDPRAALRAVK